VVRCSLGGPAAALELNLLRVLRGYRVCESGGCGGCFVRVWYVWRVFERKRILLGRANSAAHTP
jgi:hypothetical protein